MVRGRARTRCLFAVCLPRVAGIGHWRVTPSLPPEPPRLCSAATIPNCATAQVNGWKFLDKAAPLKRDLVENGGLGAGIITHAKKEAEVLGSTLCAELQTHSHQ